jgi:CRP-like cAMP-binding protein
MLPLFLENTAEDIALVQSLKQREIRFNAGEPVIQEGQKEAPLLTLRVGWAFRFMTLSDGRRQILNFLLPGDFIGVQQRMTDVAAHGVMALTDAVFCVFKREALWDLHRQSPAMGFNITWVTASEESLVDGTLLSVGSRTAEERIAALLVKIFSGAAARQNSPAADGVVFPINQQEIADAMGLSLVHTNKTLRKLERRGLHRIVNGRLFIYDSVALRKIADFYGAGRAPSRPLI